MRFCLFIICISSLVLACSSVRTVSSFEQIVKDGTYLIASDIDLHGSTFNLPKGVTLKFGDFIIKNGTLVGADTQIEYKKSCFENVRIKGTWNVPVIRSSMFTDIQQRGLSEMMNLQNGEVHNDITIEPGTYHVNTNVNRSALSVRSNAALHLLGHVILDSQTNDKFYNGYYLVSVNGAVNVTIDGNGVLEGDQLRTMVKPEYGHAICVFGSDSVDISGITIKDVNGDGIAISLGCKNVSIHDLRIENYYRNGISVVDGELVRIDRVDVSNGGKMSPYAAIDVEPNKGYTVERVVVNDLNIQNCGVGLSGCASNEAPVKIVEYSNVSMQGIERDCIVSLGFDCLVLSNIDIKQTPKAKYVLRLIDCNNVEVNHLSAQLGDNSSKYPFYVSCGRFNVKNSSFECPQLFTWHLSNASFINTKFVYKSFVWTAKNIVSKNLTFNNCDFKGPLFMRPSNVTIKNSKFNNGSSIASVPVIFEEATMTDNSSPGVVFDNNTIEGRLSDNVGIQSSVRNSSISGNKSKSGRSLFYKISGTNVHSSKNK